MNASATVQDRVKRRNETISGLAVSRGLAFAPAFIYGGDRDLSVPEYAVPEDKIAAELLRYDAAQAETRRQLENLISELGTHARSENAKIFANHLMILDDASVVKSVKDVVRTERINVEAAMHRVVDRFRQMFARMNDPYLRERVRDIDDVERRIIGNLLGKSESPLVKIDRPVILVADDLTPSETATLPRSIILGIATNRGSTTSHVSLIARSLGIPAVAGLGDVTERVATGETILLDGTHGNVVVDPDEQSAEAFALRKSQADAMLARMDSSAGDSTRNSIGVTFLANVQPGVPFDGLADSGARGIGLYRSEYLWINAGGEPTEEEQTSAYIAAVRATSSLGEGARCVFRVFDLGGDKFAQGVKTSETNPFLGNRSLRWLLSHRQAFRSQLRAMLKASAHGRAAIMYPMVATREELRAANGVLREAMEQLHMAGIPFDSSIPKGAMIEVPSAALNAASLAKEVDFFSIGTNDLVQYTMAADRGNREVAYLYQPANPAVIRLVAQTAAAARAAHITVSVCGESASDPILAFLWASLGVDALSMSAGFIPSVRSLFKALSPKDAADLAEAVRARLDDSSADEIYSLCRDFLLARLPHEESFKEMLGGQ